MLLLIGAIINGLALWSKYKTLVIPNFCHYMTTLAKYFVAAPMGEFASHFESQIRTEIGSQF